MKEKRVDIEAKPPPPVGLPAVPSYLSRRAYLDELERRHHEEFAAWIPGARAAGDPAKFFKHHHN